MTEEELYEKFYSIFCETFGQGSIDRYEKIGQRSIFVFLMSGEKLLFIWNDNHNWILSSVVNDYRM